MHWAAGLYAAGLWMVVTAIWITLRRERQPVSELALSLRILRDLGPAVLLGALVARLV